MSAPSFTNLIRFLDENSVEWYGQVAPESLNNIEGAVVKVLGHDIENIRDTGTTAVVKKLLAPLSHVPHFTCIGLNYAAHVKEANMELPENPVIFMKPADALAGPYDTITVPKEAHLLDYEGELCIIIGKDGKDIQPKDAIDHIFGYTVGNDLSSRHWQRPPRAGGQFCYAKSFDGFAPIGPTILSPHVATAESLHLTTKVNGEVRQQSPISDMIFNVQDIICHCFSRNNVAQGNSYYDGHAEWHRGQNAWFPLASKWGCCRGYYIAYWHSEE
ncbi:Fumarylacetoacetase-like, C-terminal domain superfamily [Fusarium oxysporum f. sp. vasinfectum]|nr:Fumarylacetoacetase-like, C-terminal domain superfamily [Fusarium oxysporum f. sp. vasinfectum]